MKAVIIDDEYWTRNSIRRLADWERFGIVRVEEAEEGLSGLQIIQSIQPDIVITDMKMRGMNGVELLQKLSEDYPFIRKIVISGYDDFAYTKQAIQSKVDEYILKPIHPEELNRALEKAVRELQIARGLHAVQPLDKEILHMMTDAKQVITRNFQGLEVEGVCKKFAELATVLTALEPLQAGISNSLYKQFMYLLEEQVSRMLADTKSVIPASTGTLIVTDDTPVAQWVHMLTEAYMGVMEELIQKRRNKTRINIDEVRHYIERTYAEPITLESVAGQFFVSKEHLSRTFKQEVGSTVMDYIITMRVEKAKQLLQNPATSIKSAAEAVGYADLTYFHRIFKKVTGLTPGQIRNDSHE
ncbi:response regulator transcription factor [Paenibacillus aestuarii]|uniref:Helix-turn-helix domain-containing protein n=1 Tax=Paenibacillus aestuarii TaxID=516965 RepID=A0ABW0KDB9_9BACL|nr:helix-turn-helix domain-containing protein [Paenibacillus aestuarii]